MTNLYQFCACGCVRSACCTYTLMPGQIGRRQFWRQSVRSSILRDCGRTKSPCDEYPTARPCKDAVASRTAAPATSLAAACRCPTQLQCRAAICVNVPRCAQLCTPTNLPIYDSKRQQCPQNTRHVVLHLEEIMMRGYVCAFKHKCVQLYPTGNKYVSTHACVHTVTTNGFPSCLQSRNSSSINHMCCNDVLAVR